MRVAVSGVVMDLKKRLEKIDSIAGGREQVREQIVSDLRRRLERLVDPRRKKNGEGITSPIEEWVRGEGLETPYGKVFVSQEDHRSGYRHGGELLDRVMEIPSYPVSFVSPDEALVDLDFSRALFLDTETTGLAGGTGTCAFLVGVGYFENSRFITRQFFLRDFSEEKPMLWLLRELAGRFQFLVTFNGKRFDIPLLETRFILSGIESPFTEMPNYDLLFPSRRIWKGIYEDCRLATLETRALGIHRHGDVPGELIPDLYFEYLRNGDAGRIQQVFYHNRMDVLSMVILAARLHELVDAPQTASRRQWGEAYALGKLFTREKISERAIECFHDALRACKDSGEWEILRSLSLVLKKEKQLAQAASVWNEMVAFDGTCELFPYVELAKYHEHVKKDTTEALRWVEAAFEALSHLSPEEMTSLERRHQRLRRREQKRKEKGVGLSQDRETPMP
jgi:uncharacterized protein YprB with RNaseH-like and TPR domain